MTSHVTGGKTEAYDVCTKGIGFRKGRWLGKRRWSLGTLCPSAPLPGSRPRLSQAKMGAFAGLVCEIPADWTLASCCPMQTELQGGSSEWSGPQEGEMWEVSPHRWFPKWNQEELMGGGAAEAVSALPGAQLSLWVPPGVQAAQQCPPPLVTAVPEVPLLTASPRKSRAELRRGKEHHSQGHFPGCVGTLVFFSGKWKKHQPERVLRAPGPVPGTPEGKRGLFIQNCTSALQTPLPRPAVE